MLFHAQLAQERVARDIHDLERDIVAKLVLRHPNVFGDIEVDGADEVLVNWAAIKKSEKAELRHDHAAGNPTTRP